MLKLTLKVNNSENNNYSRLARAGPRSESTQYELVRIDGCFKRADLSPRGRPSSGPAGLQLIRRARGRDDNIPLHSISGNDIVSYSFHSSSAPNSATIFDNLLTSITFFIYNINNCLFSHSFTQILIAMARVIKPPSFCDRFIEASSYEYKTRHLIDGRFVTCDQRISIVAGYMTEEVLGLSPFTFMHRDDVRWVMVALRQSKLNEKYRGF